MISSLKLFFSGLSSEIEDLYEITAPMLLWRCLLVVFVKASTDNRMTLVILARARRFICSGPKRKDR